MVQASALEVGQWPRPLSSIVMYTFDLSLVAPGTSPQDNFYFRLNKANISLSLSLSLSPPRSRSLLFSLSQHLSFDLNLELDHLFNYQSIFLSIYLFKYLSFPCSLSPCLLFLYHSVSPFFQVPLSPSLCFIYLSFPLSFYLSYLYVCFYLSLSSLPSSFLPHSTSLCLSLSHASFPPSQGLPASLPLPPSFPPFPLFLPPSRSLSLPPSLPSFLSKYIVYNLNMSWPADAAGAESSQDGEVGSNSAPPVGFSTLRSRPEHIALAIALLAPCSPQIASPRRGY